MNSFLQNKHSVFAIFAALLLGLSAPALFAQAQLSGTPDELREFLFPRPNTVNISGEGEMTAYKDIANVALLVTTTARDLNIAMADNESIRQELIAQFLTGGIDEEDINNSNFSSSPQYGLFGRNPNSYEVTARLQISVASEQHLQMVAAAADEFSEVEFDHIEFEHSESDLFENQVRDAAVQDVMEQKAYFEANLGVQLRAVNFRYGRVFQSQPQPLFAAEATLRSSDSSAAVSAPAMAAVTPSFDEVEYRTSVNVVFEIVSEN